MKLNFDFVNFLVEQIFVRAQFDYNPLDDDMIPCAQAGIAFQTGDILQVSRRAQHLYKLKETTTMSSPIFTRLLTRMIISGGRLGMILPVVLQASYHPQSYRNTELHVKQ